MRGVTYGTFIAAVPGDDGYDPARADDDFARMATAGINAIRLYTVPPAWLLDAAERHGLWVAVDIPWEEHITFLDQPGLTRLDSGGRVTEGIDAAPGIRPCSRSASATRSRPGSSAGTAPRASRTFLERLTDTVRERRTRAPSSPT